MRQLTALDEQFLALEGSRHYGHIGAVAVVDPSTAPGGRLELLDLQDVIAERLPLVPPFRWRLVEVPFDLDYDYWIDDPTSTSTSTSASRDAAARERTKLAEQVARIFARPLDRSRPLWELYLIHGLERQVRGDDKVHHAVIDGLSGARSWARCSISLRKGANRRRRGRPSRRPQAWRARDARARVTGLPR